MYLKSIRRERGMTLRQVEEKTGVSNAYISLLENGLRQSPNPDILRKLAEVYSVPPVELMRRAEYITDQDEGLSEESKLEQAFRHVLSDANFQYGTRITGPVSKEIMRFIVELYQSQSGKKLL